MITKKRKRPPGRRSLIKEMALILRFFRECVRGAYTFHRIHNCITVYGSARFKETHVYYQLAQELGKQLALSGFAVMTGGGPGIMEAANRGAKDVVDSLSIGCAIALPFEEKRNDYLDKSITLRYFFSRKLMLSKHSVGFVALPGGYGTMDELFEMAVLIQTKRIKDFPLVLMGADYWQPLLDYLRDVFITHETIGASDIETVFFLTDSVDDAIAYIKSKVGHDDKN